MTAKPESPSPVKIEITLCLPRDSDTIALVRDVAMGALAKVGVQLDCVEDIRLALSEACTNVIDHSDAADEYEVHLSVEMDVCEIRVIDCGRGLDFATIASMADDTPDRKRGRMPGPLSARGRGLAIIEAVVDAVAFESRPEVGTMVHLVKRLELDPDGPLARLVRRRSPS